MAQHKCPRCGFETRYLSHIYSHFARKKPCKAILEDIPFETLKESYTIGVCASACTNLCASVCASIGHEALDMKKYKCKYCDKSYTHNQSLYKHMKKHHNTSSGVVSREEYESLQQEIQNLKMNQTQTKTTQQLTINNTTNQIFIVNSFGNENIDYINEDYIEKLLKQPKKGINSLIRQIHFNPGRPENHNIKITNKKLPYINVFTNHGWEIDDKKKIINNMINRSYSLMEDVYEDKEGSLEPSTKRVYNKFQKKYEEDDFQLKKELQKITEIQIINERKALEG